MFDDSDKEMFDAQMISNLKDRIQLLEETGRELLIEAMNQYQSSGRWKKTAEEYFEKEIKLFNLQVDKEGRLSL